MSITSLADLIKSLSDTSSEKPLYLYISPIVLATTMVSILFKLQQQNNQTNVFCIETYKIVIIQNIYEIIQQTT